MTITCAVLWPAFAVLWVLADQVVLVLFGPAWIDSADVFRALIGSAAAQTVGYVTVWVFIATGQGRLQTMWACTTLPLSVVGSCVGAQWGVIGVGIAASVSVALLVLPGFLIAARRTPLHLRDLLSCLPGPAALAALCAAAAGAVLSVPTGASSVAVIMTCCSAAILVWAVVVVTVPRARRRSLAVVRRVVVRAA